MADLHHWRSAGLRGAGLGTTFTVALALAAGSPVRAQAPFVDAPPPQDLPAPQFGKPAAELPEPPSQPVARALRVALFNLQDAQAAGAVPKFESPVRATWRHTFGAERRTLETQGPPRLDPMAWSADVVLLQGFTHPRETRRLFPARGWKLVMPRPLIDARAVAAPAANPNAAARPSTAIAVRHKRGVRIAGFDAQLDPAVGTAVRLQVAGAPVWFLSVAQPDSGAAAIEVWLDARRAAGEQVVLGGRLPASLPRDRGASVKYAPKAATERPAAVAALLASGERRLVDGGAKAFARFPAANPPSPCGGSPAGADAIVVDQQIADRMQPDSGGWIVTLKKPAPAAPAATGMAAPAPQPAPQPQSKPGSPAKVQASVPPPAPITAPPAPVLPSAVCVLLLDMGV